MKKSHYCNECKREKYFDLICDVCGKSVFGTKEYIKTMIRDAEYHFCNEKCANKFFAEELRKNNPETRFITGRKK